MISPPSGRVKELGDGFGISRPSVFVADVGSKELNKAPGGSFSGSGDRRGKFFQAGSAEFVRRDRNDFEGHDWDVKY